MPSPPEVRAQAATLLSRIIVRKHTSDQVLGSANVDPLLLELLYGSLRHYYSLSAVVDRSLKKPLRIKDDDVRCLIIVGLYQLHHTRIPPHAALNETVAAARVLKKPWAIGLVNAVLRNAPAPERSFEHPRWMERALESDYRDLAAALMMANNERAPMSLRINLAKSSPEGYREVLRTAGLEFRSPALKADTHDIQSWGPETLILRQPVATRALPGYSEGLVSVQDAGAQLAAAALGSHDSDGKECIAGAKLHGRFLDACAAPGGKLFHIIERNPGLEAVAIDASEQRTDTLNKEGQRLGHRGYEAIVGDATQLDWWDRRPFDYVLIDAPCSGSGTLRRHPDIKLLRSASDLPRYQALQGTLLRTLWQVLAPGGTLLYCTCSLFQAENDDVVGPFLGQQRDAIAGDIKLVTGQSTRFGWQLLPIDGDTDGFYFARIHKSHR
jgi:16S rRNA (cytosine967-C5)-methyltransferase